MMQYAQDALETDKPWERWEFNSGEGHWRDAKKPILWFATSKYRRKPRTIRIGAFDVPEPCRGPLEKGTCYYKPTLSTEVMACPRKWMGSSLDYEAIKRGIAHLTEEAAVIHTEALIALSSAPAADASATDDGWIDAPAAHPQSMVEVVFWAGTTATAQAGNLNWGEQGDLTIVKFRYL